MGQAERVSLIGSGNSPETSTGEDDGSGTSGSGSNTGLGEGGISGTSAGSVDGRVRHRCRCAWSGYRIR